MIVSDHSELYQGLLHRVEEVLATPIVSEPDATTELRPEVQERGQRVAQLLEALAGAQIKVAERGSLDFRVAGDIRQLEQCLDAYFLEQGYRPEHPEPNGAGRELRYTGEALVRFDVTIADATPGENYLVSVVPRDDFLALPMGGVH